MKTVVFPIVCKVEMYLINDFDDSVAKIGFDFGGGALPSTEQVIEKLKECELGFSQNGEGEGLRGRFRICTREEYLNAVIQERFPHLSENYAFPRLDDDKVWFTDIEGCGCASCEPKPPVDDPVEKPREADSNKELFWKLEGDSLDAIVEVVGEGNDFRQYNKGKGMMRDWFLGRLSRAFGMDWKREQPVAEDKQKSPKDAPDYAGSYGDLDAGAANNTDPNKRGFDPQ